MPLPDPLPIAPFVRPVTGEARLPGSKSITNRALLLAALCDGPVELTGALFSEDTAIMAGALRRLGFAVAEDPGARSIRVQGLGGKIPAKEADLHVGLAGTAARFLTALCAAAPSGTFRIDGVPQMRKRPMKGLIDALRTLGADIRCTAGEGHFPLEIRARGLNGGDVTIDASESSQMLSALLMVAPLAGNDVRLFAAGELRKSYVLMTMNLMERFGFPGFPSSTFAQGIQVRRGSYRQPDGRFEIEADASAASYFVALPLVAGGTIEVRGFGLTMPLQGDVAFARLLEQHGLISRLNHQATTQHFSRGPKAAGLEADFFEFSDTFLTLAAIAPLLEGRTRITGIAHTRRQETDRVAGMAAELRRLGQEVDEEPDALAITPRPAALRAIAAKGPVEIETYGDHRFAMSFGILGCHDLLGNGKPWLSVRNPGCCAKTFPGFFEELARLRAGT